MVVPQGWVASFVSIPFFSYFFAFVREVSMWVFGLIFLLLRSVS